ncbi:MAG: PAS domain-containing sensor histidine kinase [Phycisphaerae bacterium]
MSASEDRNEQHDHSKERVDELRNLAATLAPGGGPARKAMAELSGLVDEIDDLRRSIDDLQLQEDELRRENQELARQRQRYHELFEYAPDAYVVTDLGGNIQQLNRAAARLLDLEHDQALDRPLSYCILPEDRSRFWAELSRMVGSKEVDELDLRVQLPGRQIIEVSVRVGPVFYVPDKPAGLRWVIRDVTSRRRTEHLLREALHRLQQLERVTSMGKLAMGVAHEINNALTSILWTVEYASRFPEDGMQLAMGTVREEIQRAGRMARGFLRCVHEASAAKTPLDFNDVVRHAAEAARATLGGEQLQVELDLQPGLPLVKLNASEFEQVILNLMRNAAEATGGKVHIRIATAFEGEWVRMTVTDDGPGIPEESLPRIFDPFYSTRQQAGGAGLGLSVAHGIITDHGGSIAVRTRRGEGATFTVRLPGVANG